MGFFRLVDYLEAGLDSAAYRQQLLNHNLANANTPGFQRRDFDFASVLQQWGSSTSIEPNATHPRHFARSTSSAPMTDYARRASMRRDGSNIDVEQEMVMVLENQLHYQAMADALNRKLGHLRVAIAEGR